MDGDIEVKRIQKYKGLIISVPHFTRLNHCNFPIIITIGGGNCLLLCGGNGGPPVTLFNS